MTIEELCYILQNQIDNGMGDKEIMFAYPSGDYWGSVITKSPVRCEEIPIVWSEYHNSYKLVREDDSGNGEKSVFVLG